MQWMIMEGRPDTGLRFFGPFQTESEAMAWAERSLYAKDWWWTAKLEQEV